MIAKTIGELIADLKPNEQLTFKNNEELSALKVTFEIMRLLHACYQSLI
jgi:hypothetical protein